MTEQPHGQPTTWPEGIVAEANEYGGLFNEWGDIMRILNHFPTEPGKRYRILVLPAQAAATEPEPRPHVHDYSWAFDEVAEMYHCKCGASANGDYVDGYNQRGRDDEQRQRAG